MSLARFWKRQFGLDRIVWVLFLGNLISAVGRFMMRPFMTMYIYDRFHVPLTQLGWYVGLSSLAGIVFNTLAGTLADQVGRRPVMAGSLLLSGVFILGYTVTHSLAAFTILFILHGAVSALFFPASSAVIADVTPSEQRLQAFGLTRIAVNTGAVVGPMAAGFILTGRSYHTAFLITAVSDFIFLTLVLALVPETRPTVTPAASQAPPTAASGYREVLADGLFLLFILVGLLVSVSYSQLESTLPLHLTRTLRLPVKTYASLLALNGALVVLLQAPTTAVVSRWRTGRTLALSSVLYALGFGSYAFLRSFAPLAAMMVIITLGEVIANPSFSKFVADISPAHLRGRYMAASGLGWSVAGVVGPIVGTTMMGAWGGGSVWIAAGLVCAAAAGLYLMLENALTRRAAGLGRGRPLRLHTLLLVALLLGGALAARAAAPPPPVSLATLQARLEEGMREYSEAKLENVRRALAAWPLEAYTSGAWLVRGEAEERLAELALLHDPKEAERLALEAVRSLKRSIALSDSAQVRAALAHTYQILAHTSRINGARFSPHIPEEVRRAIALDPSNFNARLMEIQGYIEAPPVFGGNLPKGIDLLRGLSLEFPDSDRVLYDLARSLAKSGDKKAALSYGEAALRANPQNPFAARLVASLHQP